MLFRSHWLPRLSFSVAMLSQAAILNLGVSTVLAASESSPRVNATGPDWLMTSEKANIGKHRNHVHVYADHLHGELLRTTNNTGMINPKGLNIGPTEADKEHLKITIISATALYCAAALYGFLHLPVWTTFSRMFTLKRVGPSSEMPEDNIAMIDLSLNKDQEHKKTVRWAPSSDVTVQ